MLPGLERAEFARLGGLHRNTFLNSPRLLDERLRLKARPQLRFAGQITGCEGYVESAAVGIIVGRLTAAEVLRRSLAPPPPTTAIGALINHITGGHIELIDAGPRSFQPMNVNFGLFPPIPAPVNEEAGRARRPERGDARKRALSARAREEMELWAASASVAKPSAILSRFASRQPHGRRSVRRRHPRRRLGSKFVLTPAK